MTFLALRKRSRSSTVTVATCVKESASPWPIWVARSTTNPPKSSMSLPSTYFCGRAQSSLIPLPSTSKVRSSIGSGATSSGGRTAVLRPQADKKVTENRLEVTKKREQRTEKNFLKPLPHDFALCTLHFALWTLDFALCTLHFALMA